MRTISLFKTAAMTGLMAFAVSPLAFAQSQCEEDTCEAGYDCVESSYENCEWACEDSEDGSGECYTTGCETVDTAYCERAACDTDADCGESMVCHTFTATCAAMPMPTCPPGVECDVPEPMPCEAIEYSQCTPRSELPCEEASDCGEGFDCEPSTICTCSGGMATPGTEPGAGSEGSGGGSSSGSGGATPTPVAPSLPQAPPTTDGDVAPAPPSDCACEPSGTNYCQMKTIACEADADCPADWSCIESPGACWADSEGNTGCSEGSSQCYPPSSGGGPTNPTTPTPGGPVSSPGDNGGGEEQEDDGDVGGDPAPEPPKGPGNGGGHGGGHHNGGHDNPFQQLFPLWGCSVENVVGTSSGTSPWAVFAVGLGAALLRRRRR